MNAHVDRLIRLALPFREDEQVPTRRPPLRKCVTLDSDEAAAAAAAAEAAEAAETDVAAGAVRGGGELDVFDIEEDDEEVEVEEAQVGGGRQQQQQQQQQQLRAQQGQQRHHQQRATMGGKQQGQYDLGSCSK